MVLAQKYASGAKWFPATVTKVFNCVTYVVKTERCLLQRHQNQLQCQLYDFETCDSGGDCSTNAKNCDLVETRDTSQSCTLHSHYNKRRVSRRTPTASVSRWVSSWFFLIDFL